MEATSSGLVAEAKKKLQRKNSVTCKLKTKASVPVAKTPNDKVQTAKINIDRPQQKLRLDIKSSNNAKENDFKKQTGLSSQTSGSTPNKSSVSSLVNKFGDVNTNTSPQKAKTPVLSSPVRHHKKLELRTSRSLGEGSESVDISEQLAHKRLSLSPVSGTGNLLRSSIDRSEPNDKPVWFNKQNVLNTKSKQVPLVLNRLVADKVSKFDGISEKTTSAVSNAGSSPKSWSSHSGVDSSSSNVKPSALLKEQVSQSKEAGVASVNTGCVVKSSSLHKTNAINVTSQVVQNETKNVASDGDKKVIYKSTLTTVTLKPATLTTNVPKKPGSPRVPQNTKGVLTKTSQVTDTDGEKGCDAVTSRMKHQIDTVSRSMISQQIQNLEKQTKIDGAVSASKSHPSSDSIQKVTDRTNLKISSSPIVSSKTSVPASLATSDPDSDEYDDIIVPSVEKDNQNLDDYDDVIVSTSEHGHQKTMILASDHQQGQTPNRDHSNVSNLPTDGSGLSDCKVIDRKGATDSALKCPAIEDVKSVPSPEVSSDSWEDCDPVTSSQPQNKIPIRPKRRSKKRSAPALPPRNNASGVTAPVPATSSQNDKRLPKQSRPFSEEWQTDSSDDSYQDIDDNSCRGVPDYLIPLPALSPPTIVVDSTDDEVKLPNFKSKAKKSSPGFLKTIHGKIKTISKENMSKLRRGENRNVRETSSDPMAAAKLLQTESVSSSHNARLKASRSTGDVRERLVIGPPLPEKKAFIKNVASPPPPLPPRTHVKQTKVTMDMVVPLPGDPGHGFRYGRNAKSVGNLLNNRTTLADISDSYLINPKAAHEIGQWRSCDELTNETADSSSRPQKALSMAGNLLNIPPPPQNYPSSGEGYLHMNSEAYQSHDPSEVVTSGQTDQFMSNEFATFPRARDRKSGQKQGYKSMEGVAPSEGYLSMDDADKKAQGRHGYISMDDADKKDHGRHGYLSMDGVDSGIYIDSDDIASYPATKRTKSPMRKSTPDPFSELWSPRESNMESVDITRDQNLELNLDEAVPVEKRIARKSNISRKRFASRFFDDQPLYQVYHKVDRSFLTDDENNIIIGNHDDTSDIPVFDEDTIMPVDASETMLSPGGTSVSNLRRMSHSRQGMRTLWSEMPEVKESGLLDNLSENEKKIQEATFELITSEASYLRSLNILIDSFYNAPEFSDDTDATDSVSFIGKASQDKHFLFSNVVAVADLSEKMLKNLENKWDESVLLKPEEIIEVIHDHAVNHFDIYVTYCRNQVYQLRTLDKLRKLPEFPSTLRRLEQTSDCQGLTMQSFLLLPMQRITRLPLLIDAVYHRMDQNNLHIHSIHNALQLLNKTVKRCNEEAKQMETIELISQINSKLEWGSLKRFPMISQSRYIVKQGSVTNIISGNSKKSLFRKKAVKQKLQMFLFNDILLVTEKKTSQYLGVSEEKLVVLDYAPRIALHLELIDEENTEDMSKWLPLGVPSGCKHLVAVTMLENHQQKQSYFVIACESVSERQRWVDAMMPAEQENPQERIYEDWDCPQVQAIRRYVAEESDELTLEETDIVNVFKKMADGWYEGERIRDQQRGWFPSSYTVEIHSAHLRAKNLRQRYRLLQAAAEHVATTNSHR